MNRIGDSDWKWSLTYLLMAIVILAIFISASISNLMLAEEMLAKQRAQKNVATDAEEEK